MAKETIKEMLKMIDAKIEHIEDMTADHRAIIVKLVTQSNSIVKFLSQLQIDEISDMDAQIEALSDIKTDDDIKREHKLSELKELMDEFKERHSQMSELEKELEKHKDEITPGQVGEA